MKKHCHEINFFSLLSFFLSVNESTVSSFQRACVCWFCFFSPFLSFDQQIMQFIFLYAAYVVFTDTLFIFMIFHLIRCSFKRTRNLIDSVGPQKKQQKQAEFCSRSVPISTKMHKHTPFPGKWRVEREKTVWHELNASDVYFTRTYY